jgi:predicted small lipoprotein YifL
MRLIGLILLLLSTATCGQEGPLYLPEASSRSAEWHPPGPSSLTNASHDFR